MEAELNSCSLTHPICQQEIRGCHAMFDHRPWKFFILLFIFYFCMGILLVATQIDFTEVKVRYDNKCSDGQTSTISLDIPKKLTGRKFFYYELHGFYQNHFRFEGSVDYAQLAGKYDDDIRQCRPMEFDQENHVYAPCGLFPLFFFTDYYVLPSEYKFNETGISWAGEKEALFKGLSDKYTGKSRWMKTGLQSVYFPGEISNEHFIVWMRTANNPTFKKLFSYTDEEIPVGQFNVTVTCNYPKQYYSGERYISLVRPCYFGGRNKVLYITNFVLSGFILIGIFIFRFCQSNRRVGYDQLKNDGEVDLDV